ncbi:protein of unknown function [Streptomyces sp. DvalAA-14]|uniref:DUF4331 family protein n=1 Tax=unclassified Streptomyces TaxID=2593676 RepID=UPI00081BAC00|nr:MULTISPECIES: DUF4331 family protein [unclassified Streptomyces]MYS23693.1 DUF4331 domain-containing protein [Streptomyces sp. SID4948]SCE37350.1 protein of unknown function [Streptomyces sp. DvalAA-14]
MSHHFDTDAARDDSRLNVLDMYLFRGSTPDTTAMILTSNPDAGIFAPLTLHPEGLYAFRFDLDGDGREEVSFKFSFDEPFHIDGSADEHGQNFTVTRATAADAVNGGPGEVLVQGTVGQERESDGVRAYVGKAAELWAADAFGFFTVVNGLFQEDRFATEAFDHKANLFKNRNNMATVLEVPNSMIGSGTVGAWATASLHGHAPETQVYRWGLPLFTHLFLSDPATPGLADRYRTSVPANDTADFGEVVESFITTMSRHAGKIADPETYGRETAKRLIPAVLPYEIGTEAEFTLDRFNGRPLGTDAFDIMLTLGAGTPVADGVSPDAPRARAEFPYVGLPYDDTEQSGLRPLRELIGLDY